MTSRTDVVRARLEQLNRQREKTHTQEDQQARTDRRETVSVRRAVMLEHPEHLELSRWCQSTAAELGLSRVTGQDVLRMLVIRLLTDPALARQLRADLGDHWAR